MLRKAVVEHWTPPDEYLEAKKRQLEQKDAQERLQRRKAEATAAAEQKTHEEALKRAYFDFLGVRLGEEAEKTQPETLASFKNDESEKRAAVECDPAHKGAAKKIHLRLFDDEESRLERFRDFFGEPSFEDWKKRHVEASE